MASLRTKFLIALTLVALLGVGTVALVANRVIAREFTLYVGSGGRMRAQRLASEAAALYEETGSWQGIQRYLVETSVGHVPGQGQGRGQGTIESTEPRLDRILIIDPGGQVVSVEAIGEEL